MNYIRSKLAVAALLAATCSLPAVTTAQTVFPNDGVIDHIRFLRDGVEIKMTHRGMLIDAFYAPNRVAAKVRAWHERVIRGSTAIRTAPLSRQIFYHAVAYSFGERTRSNPINVSWREIL